MSDRLPSLPGRDGVLLPVLIVLVLLAVSVFLRTRALGESLWMDEGLSIGIASQGFFHIPGTLQLDGSPPFYYMLLSLWIGVFGDGPAETQGLSMAIALLGVPLGLWAGWSLFGRRAGLICAALCAVNPFLTNYAQETRMYSLMLVLSLVTTAAFLHVFAFGRRSYLPLFAVLLALMLYTHNWGLFMAAARAAGADPVLAGLEGPLVVPQGRAARLRRRRAALPALGADAVASGAAHGRPVARPAAPRRAGSDRQVAARRRHPDGGAAARRRVGNRGDRRAPGRRQGADGGDRRRGAVHRHARDRLARLPGLAGVDDALPRRRARARCC